MSFILKKSACSEWRTPQWLFDMFDKRYHFDLDAAASSDNALCPHFNSVKIPFQSVLPKHLLDTSTAIFCNPPYDVKSLKSFIDFIVNYTKISNYENRHIVTVLLVPCKTDQSWWQLSCQYATELHFICGRLRFSETKETSQQSHAIFIFDSYYLYHRKIMFINQPVVKQ